MSRQVAWVTGGGTGIGKAMARTLSQAGYHVAISGRRAEVLEQTAQELGVGVIALAGDISDGATVHRIVKAIHERWGDVDLLINNAGVNPNRSFDETSAEEFIDNFRINCVSAIHCVKAVLPAMRARKNGIIVNVSSVLGKWASAGSPAYSVSKYAVTGFTDSLRQELHGSGVHVMGVYPGFIRTAMTQPFVKAGSKRDRVGRTPDQMARAILQGILAREIEVHYPAYVPIALTLYQRFPRLMEAVRRKMERSDE